jgi:GNAT superfamily N-acetyltransferase
MSPAVEIRETSADDRPAILDLLATCLGWHDDERFAALYEWKHHANPFGPSACWIATAGDRVLGFRAFLRWELERNGSVVRAARAVDTATAPEARGQGVFRNLTLHALDAIRAEGVDLVFNLPNDRSGAGYLSMGWVTVGRIRRRVRPRSIVGLARLAASHGSTDRWSEPSTVGTSAGEALRDAEVVNALLASRPPSPYLRTRLTRPYLVWRYDNPVVPARVVTHADGPQAGLAVLRVRRRGNSRVAALEHVIVPEDDTREHSKLARVAAASADADATITLGRRLGMRDGFLPLGGRGPLLMARGVGVDAPAALDDWDLSFGDLELF